MLKTAQLQGQSNRKGVALLLGGFDGLHVGHRRLLQKAQESGLPVGIMTIVGGKQESALFTVAEREQIFKDAGVGFAFELEFSEIKNLTPQAFLDLLLREFSPKLFVCGEDFRFGAGAKGTPEFLKAHTQVCVETLPLVEMDGVKVSSSHIKTLLSKGEIERANARLKRPFFLMGKVVEDRKVGRTIGFPTANIFYPKDKYPLKQGVYETLTEVDGTAYKGITNFGARPTFADETVLTETHLIGYEGDLYGRELSVQFTRYLRDIQKFESAEKLKEQLTKDIRQVKNHD